MRSGLTGILLALASAGAGAQTTVFRPSPIRAKAAPVVAGAIEVEVDADIVKSLRGHAHLLVDEFALSDGRIVALSLEPIEVDFGPTWVIDDAGRVPPRQIAPVAVDAFTGTVVGHPGSRVFLGFDQGTVHGYIESSFGLDMVVTEPGRDHTSMYRVGGTRGGVDVEPPATGMVSTAADDYRSEQLRLLAAIADPDSPLHGRIDASMVLDLINRSTHFNPDILYSERGGCCLAPGFCFYISEEQCGAFCVEDSVDCDDLIFACTDPDDDDPTISAPCFLGVGVQCSAQWVCYESFDDPADPDNPATGNWYGACCFMDDDDCDDATPPVLTLADMQSCECAIVGGRFIVPPYPCLGDELPWEFPADRFVSAQSLEDTGQFDCSEPFGACCLDQALLCAGTGDDPDDLPDLSSIRCAQLPRVVCESDDPTMLAALNTAVPGSFILECMPCLDQVDLSLYEGIDLPDGDSLPIAALGNSSPPICSAYSTVFELEDPLDPESDLIPSEILGPENLRCVPMEILFDSDQFFLAMFAGDTAAASGYARILAAAVFSTIRDDTTLEFHVSGIVLHDWMVDEDGDGVDDFNPAPLGIGACCFGGFCMDNLWEEQCIHWTGTFEGEGSSCWTEPCGQAYTPTDDAYQHAPLDITLALDRLEDAWLEDLRTSSSANWGGDDAQTQGLQELFCRSASVIALGGGPYFVPVDSSVPPEGGPAMGVRRQGVVTSGLDVLCQRENGFAMVPVRGGFAPPVITTPPGESMWDFIQVARAMGMLAGARETALYGYDNCVFFPCDSMAALPDCTLRHENPDAFALGVMPSTLMSSCLACEGSIANLQLRFRSEIAARIYANVAQANCRDQTAEGFPDVCYEIPSVTPGSPETYYDFLPDSPYPVDDLVDVLAFTGAGGTTPDVELDVLANDVRFNCNATSNGEDLQIFEDVDMPLCVAGSPTSGFETVLGGYVCTDDDGLFVQYTPPPDPWCGVDSFFYRLDDNGNPTGDATVWILPTQCSATESFQCGDCAADDCTGCPQSISEIPVVPAPPTSDAADDVYMQEFAGRAGEAIDNIAWEFELHVDTGQSAASDAVLRYWFTSAPGGPLDVFIDIRPFAADIADQCNGPFEVDVTPLGAGVECVWAAGVCAAPSGSMFLPDLDGDGNGDVLVQCYEISDDIAGADACWTSVDVCILTESTGTQPGACCIEGLCIQLTPAQCADFHWRWDSTNALWEYDLTVSGFFHGAGTSCGDRDWCTGKAPCCLGQGQGCVEIEPSVCEGALGGTVLRVPDDVVNGGEPLWGFPCSFTVCDLDPLTTVIGACCVDSDAGVSFCVNTVKDVCDNLAAIAPVPQVWETSWQVRATCEGFSCPASLGPIGTGQGACCFEGLQCCAEDIKPEVCAAALGLYLGDGSTCGLECDFGPVSGACCLDTSSIGSDFTCVEGLGMQVCTLMGGTFAASLNGCHGDLPCDPGTPFPPLSVDCCIDYDLIVIEDASTCLIAGGWVTTSGSCVPLECEVTFDTDPTTPPFPDPAIFSVPTDSDCTSVGGIVVGPAPLGDLNGDGEVDVLDLYLLIDLWGQTGGAGDLDGDNRVGMVDLLMLLESWAQG